MPVSIRVTAVDNEAYILAFNNWKSYRIAHIQSGNGKTVDVTVTLSAGTYVAPEVLNGMLTNLAVANSASIPAGTYSLCFFGLNWDGPTQFAATVDGTSVTGPVVATSGITWTPGVMTITV